MDEGDESEELTMKLSSIRQASNHGESVDDVVFGNLQLSVKDVKGFKVHLFSVPPESDSSPQIKKACFFFLSRTHRPLSSPFLLLVPILRLPT